MYPSTRLSRCRRSAALRRLAQESVLRGDELILPLFIVPGRERREPVDVMPGVERVSVDLLRRRAAGLKVSAVLLFGVPDDPAPGAGKDAIGSAALAEDGLIPSAVRALKSERPDLAVITDVCLCAYTRHGHCGPLSPAGERENERTVELLGRMACVHAAAGVDLVAPSAMADGQVQAIRAALDQGGFKDVGIMSYAAKFASAFYGPFRQAARSAQAVGDRRSYQLPPANGREAIREALLDEVEGADWLMVKPALPYLDIVAQLRERTLLPIAAYQVSGEYAMVKHAAAAGAFAEDEAALEALVCIKRAGADAIITYFAEEVIRWLGR